MKNKIFRVFCTLLSLSLVSCGGGGGSSSMAQIAQPAPAPAAATITVRGTAVAARSAYFQSTTSASRPLAATGFATATTAHLLAGLSDVPAWNCDHKYATLFAALAKNVDFDNDGMADTNLTDDAGVITFNVDTTGDRSKMINVGSAANIATMLNKDQTCSGTASLNIDTDHDGVADKDVDANGDGTADYSITSANAVTVAGAVVTLTREDTGETFKTTSDSDGRFELAGMKTGTYDMDVRARAADGSVIWNVAKAKVLPENGDMGVFGLSRNPILRSVTIDGVSQTLNTSVNVIKWSSRKLAAGDVITIDIVAEDPNGLPLTIAPFYHVADGAAPIAVNGYTLSYTVTEADMKLNSLQIGADLNNNDGHFGMDAYRDLFVSVTYNIQQSDQDTVPVLNSVTVNGLTYTNTQPQNIIFMPVTAPVADGAPISMSASYDKASGSAISWQVKDYSGPTRELLDYTGDTVTIPGSATTGVYAVKVSVVGVSSTGKGQFSTITIPVDTPELPAKLDGLMVNGKPYNEQLLHVGDVMTAQVQASDPKGLPLQYMFFLTGTPSTVDGSWTANNSLTYTITANDITNEFGLRVWIRNSDSRTDADTRADATATFPIAVSQ